MARARKVVNQLRMQRSGLELAPLMRLQRCFRRQPQQEQIWQLRWQADSLERSSNLSDSDLIDVSRTCSNFKGTIIPTSLLRTAWEFYQVQFAASYTQFVTRICSAVGTGN